MTRKSLIYLEKILWEAGTTFHLLTQAHVLGQSLRGQPQRGLDQICHSHKDQPKATNFQVLVKFVTINTSPRAEALEDEDPQIEVV